MTLALDLLERGLARAGQIVVLRRSVNGSDFDLTLRAVVRRPSAEELTAGVKATTARLVISPRAISAAGWPASGETPTPAIPDPSLPRRGDKVLVDSRLLTIDHVDPIKVDDTLARIEIQAAG